MKRKRWLLVLCAFALVATTPIQASAYMTGNRLVECMRANERIEAGKSISTADIVHSSLYLGYIQGASEVTQDIAWSPPPESQLRQAIAIVTKYLKAHPERWNEPGYVLVIDALIEAFPKKDAK